MQESPIQTEHGLLGEIDEEATGDGVIVCRDGSRAAVGLNALAVLAAELGVKRALPKSIDPVCSVRSACDAG